MMTLEFYNQNAESFFNDTIQVDMSELYRPFIQRVIPNGRILDAGCGSGRDAKAFLEKGFQVDAMDASVEMVKLATQHTGLPVKLQTLESVTDIEAYDGIWACASLLHLSEAVLPVVFTQFEAALKPKGVWYMSFKYGNGEREKNGRVFTDLNEERLQELLSHCPSLTLAEQWVTVDQRPDRDERWLNVVVTKG
ncbi:class I SAM-dependent methyltransferase [Nitrincola tibetensis]|nr:class I SAM-dependent methyltransferase [Nitrincola tibetensis]